MAWISVLAILFVLALASVVCITAIVALLRASRTNHRWHDEQIRLLTDIANGLEHMNKRVEALEVLLPQEAGKEALK